jgi:FkbM family methyltransferase
MRKSGKNIFVLFSAFISIVLLIVARHHPPSRRKIKEIWHGRVYWEGESNTTMLRSSSEKALGSIEPSNPSEPSTNLGSIEPSMKLDALTPKVNLLTVTKPMIAICAATHSKSNWRSLGDTALQNLLIPSIQKTISTSDRSKYDFRLYLAADHDDEFWLQNKNNVKSPDWLSVEIVFYDVPKHKIPFNPMMRAAFNDGAEYLVRINDDSEFVTSDWVSKAVAKLASYDPPNVGMVGPNCREGNTAIMTHDMVHRTHLDIFEHYYPDVFSAWWIDDWISKVYGPQRSTKMMDWTVKHHTHKHGTRYEVQHHEAKLLKGELEKGGAKIEAWTEKYPSKATDYQKAPDRDVLIGFATGYSVDTIYPLIHAFHQVTHVEQYIVLFVTIEQSMLDALTREFSRVIFVRPSDSKDFNFIKNPAHKRYLFIAKWLEDNASQYKRVIMTDTRDIALFANPFEQIKSVGVQVFTEIVTYEYDHKWNQKWVRNCYGEAFLQSIIKEKVTCCGVIAGTMQDMLDYLHAFIKELRNKWNCDTVGADTAIHVWVTHALSNVNVVDSEYAIIRHAPKWGKDAEKQLARDSNQKYDAQHHMLNKNGVRYALIHQLDRFSTIWKSYKAKHAKVKCTPASDKMYITSVRDKSGIEKFKMAVYKGDHISDQIAKFNAWEIHKTQELADLADTTLPSPEDGAFLDIGGNIGYYSLLFAHSGYDVIYVEPLPRNRAAMEVSLCLNPKFKQKIQVKPLALSDKTAEQRKGQSCIVIGDNWESNWDNGRLQCGSNKKCPNTKGGRPCVSVSTNTLDNVIVDKIAIVKMDIEGHECAVLKGGMSLLKKRSPKLIQYEGKGQNGCVSSLLEREGYIIGTKRGHDGNVVAKWNGADIKVSSTADAQKRATDNDTLCIGIIAYQGVKTLKNTLDSYVDNGLFEIANEIYIYFQKLDSPERRAWAEDVVNKYPGLRPIYNKKNVHYQSLFELVSACSNNKYVMLLEEDFELLSSNIEEQINNGMYMLQNGADTIRMRSRLNAGGPNYALNTIKKRGEIAKTHTINYIMTRDDAESKFPEISVCRKTPKTWCTSSKYGQFTTNPELYRTAFLTDILRKVPADTRKFNNFEPYLTKWWSRQDFVVAWSEGIFRHNRLDRTFGTLSVQKSKQDIPTTLITEDDLQHRVCDFGYKTRKRNDLKNGRQISRYSIICVMGSRKILNVFFKDIVPQIQYPFTLVTVEHDDSIPPQKKMLDTPLLQAWFGWNTGVIHPKLHAIPIGLNKGRHEHEIKTAMQTHRLKQNLVLINFKQDRDVRKKIWTLSKKWVFAKRVPYDASKGKKKKGVVGITTSNWYYDILSKYKYVACPRGLGIDTHRTWEALYMGAIPIVLKSTISSIYEGLPIIQLDKWEDLHIDSLSIPENSSYEKLDLDFWVSKILAVIPKTSISNPQSTLTQQVCFNQPSGNKWEIFKSVVMLFNKIGANYTTNAGTVLYWYRDCDFSNHEDLDFSIDFDWFVANYIRLRKLLVKDGWKGPYTGVHKAVPFHIGHEESWTKTRDGKKIKMDIFTQVHISGRYYQSLTVKSGKKYIAYPCESVFERITNHTWGGVTFRVPEPIEPYLTAKYGHWKVTDKSYKWDKSPFSTKNGQKRCSKTSMPRRLKPPEKIEVTPESTKLHNKQHKEIYPITNHTSEQECANKQLQPAMYKGKRNSDIMVKLHKMMDQLGFVWWIDQGGLIQSARGDGVYTDGDIDIAYIPRLGSEYYECSTGRYVCSEDEQITVTAKIRSVSKKIFPNLIVKVWINLHYTLMDTRGKKIIDFSPHIIMEDGIHIRSGFNTNCGKYNTNSEWPCTEYTLPEIFPLQKCYVIGVSTPCPRKLVQYLTNNNQREYMDDGFAGQRCHGCTKCLLWNRKNAGNLQAIQKTIKSMENIKSCGFGTLSDIKIVQNDDKIICETNNVEKKKLNRVRSIPVSDIKWCPQLPDSEQIISTYAKRSFVPKNDIYRKKTLIQKCHIMEMNLKAITNVLNENCLYHLDGGTLISLLRDKRINPRDSDHDIALYNCKSKWPTVIKKLIDMGFTHCRSVSLCRDGQYTDFTHMKMKNNKCSHSSATTTIPCSLTFPLQLHVGSNMYIPYNPDAYLSSFYDNWKVSSMEHGNLDKIRKPMSSTPAAGQVFKTWIQLLSSENQLVFNLDNNVRVKSKAKAIEILKNGPFELRYHNNTVYYSNKEYIKLT